MELGEEFKGPADLKACMNFKCNFSLLCLQWQLQVD